LLLTGFEGVDGLAIDITGSAGNAQLTELDGSS
jgi:hypothetical protein